MQVFTVCFDVDTLRDGEYPFDDPPVACEPGRRTLIRLSKFRNVLVHVWSNDGEQYARDTCANLGLNQYIDSYSIKEIPAEDVACPVVPGWVGDIAIDSDPEAGGLCPVTLLTEVAAQYGSGAESYTVCFDVDNTLRQGDVDQNEPPVAREGVRALLLDLSQYANVLIHVWSGQGKQYCIDFCRSVGLWPFVDSYSAKVEDLMGLGIKVQGAGTFNGDIAIDNINSTNLCPVNLIVESDDPE